MSKTTRYVPKNVDWMVPDYKIQYAGFGPKKGTPRPLPGRGKGKTFCSCCGFPSGKKLKRITSRFWRKKKIELE